MKFSHTALIGHEVQTIRTPVSPNPHISIGIGVCEIEVIYGELDIPITCLRKLSALPPTGNVECQVCYGIAVAVNRYIKFLPITNEFVAVSICWYGR